MRAVCLVALLPTSRQAGRCLVFRGGVIMAIRKLFTDSTNRFLYVEISIAQDKTVLLRVDDSTVMVEGSTINFDPLDAIELAKELHQAATAAMACAAEEGGE